MRQIIGGTLAWLALVALAGCGGASAPASVVQRAIDSRSPSRCDLYTDAFFEREAGTSAAAGRSYCRQVAASLPVVRARITGAQMHGGTAVVTAVASGQTVSYRLVDQRGRWLIDSLGR